MSNEMEVLVKSGFALVQSPVKRGNDGKKTLKGAHAVLNGENLSGAAINAGTVEWFPKSPLKFRSARPCNRQAHSELRRCLGCWHACPA